MMQIINNLSHKIVYNKNYNNKRKAAELYVYNGVENEIESEIHPEFLAVDGKDIICAGVSAIATGGLNALINENKSKISYRVNDGYVNVEMLDINDDKLQLIMDVIVTQLKTIEESYKKYVKISEK